MEPDTAVNRQSCGMLLTSMGRTRSDEIGDWFDAARDGLIRYAYLMCGDRDLADELVADAVARSWPRLRRGSIDNPDGYVRRVITTRLTDRRRHEAVRSRYLADARAVPPDDVTSDDQSRVADQLTVLELLAGLPGEQRAVIVLRFHEDRSESEIADLLEIAPGTVKSRCSRALEQMRRELQGPDPSSTASPMNGAAPSDR